ncbi:MAG TPA: hypothetical protein DCR14_02655, partial [Acidimicrobiaceae bacterium]|nr:hypothetical protein [Acidimicrobiaceae bacterium]
IIDVTGWYQDASAGTTTIDPGVGTTLVGGGDIVAVDDTTVTLAATAPVPVVDGYLVAFPGPAAPLGLSGRV